MQELLKSWKEFEASPDARNVENQKNVPTLEIRIPAEFVTSTNRQVSVLISQVISALDTLSRFINQQACVAGFIFPFSPNSTRKAIDDDLTWKRITVLKSFRPNIRLFI
jgi:hypothetical protein